MLYESSGSGQVKMYTQGKFCAFLFSTTSSTPRTVSDIFQHLVVLTAGITETVSLAGPPQEVSAASEPSSGILSLAPISNWFTSAAGLVPALIQPVVWRE